LAWRIVLEITSKAEYTEPNKDKLEYIKIKGFHKMEETLNRSKT
jgi:hypothetical protein